MSDSAREIAWWVDAFFRVSAFLMAGYALYAWLRLRDKPVAIQLAGTALMMSTDLMPVMAVGFVIMICGSVLFHRRNYRRMTEEALKRFGGTSTPAK